MGKKIATYFFLFTVFNAVSAQDCDTIYQTAKAAYYSASLDTAYTKFSIAKNCYAYNQQWEQFGSSSLAMSSILYSQGKYEQILEVLLPVCDTLHKYSHNNKNHNTLLVKNYGNIGAAYSKLDNHYKAIYYMERGLEMTDDITKKIATYNNLGTIFEDKLDYQKSITYYKKVLNILEDTFSIKNRKLTKARTFNNLARSQRYHGNYKDALQNFETGLKITNELKTQNDRQKQEKKSLIAIYYVDMAALYNDCEKYDQALSISNKIDRIKLPNLSTVTSPHLNMGYAYLGQKNYTKAVKSFKKAIQVREKLYSNKHIDKSKVYLSLGEVYYEQKKWQQALDNFQQALIQAIPIFNDTSWTSNPNIEGVHHVRTLLRILDFKTKTLYEYYQTTQNKDDLNVALNTYQTT